MVDGINKKHLGSGAVCLAVFALGFIGLRSTKLTRPVQVAIASVAAGFAAGVTFRMLQGRATKPAPDTEEAGVEERGGSPNPKPQPKAVKSGPTSKTPPKKSGPPPPFKGKTPNRI